MIYILSSSSDFLEETENLEYSTDKASLEILKCELEKYQSDWFYALNKLSEYDFSNVKEDLKWKIREQIFEGEDKLRNKVPEHLHNYFRHIDAEYTIYESEDYRR